MRDGPPRPRKPLTACLSALSVCWTLTMRGNAARLVLGLVLLWAPADTSAADSLSYPAPPNPFAQKPPEPASLEPERPPAGRLRRLRPRWQPVVCLGLLSLAGAATKPHEPSLLAAIDAYHGAGAGMASPVALRDCGIACIAHHDELVWLGWLGRWLPFAPTSIYAARELVSAAEAHQLLLWALLGGFLLRKLLPRRVGDAHLSKSFRNVLRQGRVWSLVTASFCPSGLVRARPPAAPCPKHKRGRGRGRGDRKHQAVCQHTTALNAAARLTKACPARRRRCTGCTRARCCCWWSRVSRPSSAGCSSSASTLLPGCARRPSRSWGSSPSAAPPRRA